MEWNACIRMCGLILFVTLDGRVKPNHISCEDNEQDYTEDGSLTFEIDGDVTDLLVEGQWYGAIRVVSVEFEGSITGVVIEVHEPSVKIYEALDLQGKLMDTLRGTTDNHPQEINYIDFMRKTAGDVHDILFKLITE